MFSSSILSILVVDFRILEQLDALGYVKVNEFVTFTMLKDMH